MDIKCLTKLTAEEGERLSHVYDIVELEFELSEPYNGECFFCAELCEESVYLYRDDVSISDGRFKIEAKMNFLDGLKSLPQANHEQECFPFRFQLEHEGERAVGALSIANPWYETDKGEKKDNPAAAAVKDLAGEAAETVKKEMKREVKRQVQQGKRQLKGFLRSTIRDLFN